MIKIETKHQMYSLLKRGLLGNTMRLWDSPEEMLADQNGDMESVMMRWAIRSKVPRGEFRANLKVRPWLFGEEAKGHDSLSHCRREYENYLRDNRAMPENVILAEMDSDGGRRLLTGEICRYPFDGSQYNLCLHYSLDDKLYREAMAGTCDKTTVYGCRAMEVMRAHMGDDSIEVINELLNNYDGILEFTEFERPLGIFHKRLVVWELRSTY